MTLDRGFIFRDLTTTNVVVENISRWTMTSLNYHSYLLPCMLSKSLAFFNFNFHTVV